MEWDKDTLAEQILSLLVMDLEYKEAPTHGHNPIRHQMAWAMVEDVIGKDNIQKKIKTFEEINASESVF